MLPFAVTGVVALGFAVDLCLTPRAQLARHHVALAAVAGAAVGVCAVFGLAVWLAEGA